MPRRAMPRSPAWIQISLPVVASSATSDWFFASTYIVVPATIGLNW
jgi:hypothetical protein